MSRRPIPVIVDDFGEDEWLVGPFQTLRAADYEVHSVCPGTDPADTSKTRHSVREGMPDLAERGDDFTDTLGFDEVTTDGNVVTAQAWPGRPECFGQFLDLCGTEIDCGTAVTVTAN